ncbi:MAG: HD-GYP domain-containing protein [Candidatus Brocadiia bacterium]
MRLPNLGMRHRILAGCLAISLAAVAAMTVWGLGFRRVLRSRARENCVRMADLFAGLAHDRLLDLVAESQALGEELAREGAAPQALAERWPGPRGTRGVFCAWAVYDGRGRRVAGRRPAGEAPLFDRLGIGSASLPGREQARAATALEGTHSTVLVPDGERIYALGYRAVRRPGREPLVLQVASEMAESIFPGPADAGGVRALLRPFVATADEPRLVTVGREPRLIVHRPLTCGGRQLGTVAAAMPYGPEASYERAAVLAVLLVAAGALAILGVVSWTLTDVAMVPLERVRHFIGGIQNGLEVERLENVPDDEAGAVLEAYQRVLKQSQDWADQLMESNRAMHELLCGAVEALVSAIEAKDVYTAGHSQRVADAACAVARELGWDYALTEELRLGALLHDIGKVGINLSILNKPGRLTAEEVETVRQHPIIGARILSSIPGCDGIVRDVLLHHERVDGKGYPFGTPGDRIPQSARILAIADVYDALTSRRSYRPAYPKDKALAILEEGRGTLFDPQLLDVFLTLVRRGDPGVARAGETTPRRRKRYTGHPTEQLVATAEERA